MNLKNGYKVMYEVIEGSERVLSASKTNLFADAEEIARFGKDAYDVIYQRGNDVFAVDAEGNETKISALDKLLVELPEEVEEPVVARTSRKKVKVEEPVVETTTSDENIETEEF